jgi:hypothetical protein
MHARYWRDMRPNSPLLRRIELMSKFQDTMRRVITGDNAHGQSIVIVRTLVRKGQSRSGRNVRDLGGRRLRASDAERQRRSRGCTPRARAAKGQFSGAVVRNPSPAGGRTQALA